ncbi:MAG: nucleoside triphosphate hydrolase [Acetobacter sp.]|jgi:thymidylate kinase
MPPISSLSPLIAVVGCDGSGKSTVTDSLQKWLATSRPTVICHLGKQSGNIGRAIGRLPFVGGLVETKLNSKAKKVHSDKGPDTLSALVTYFFTLRRYWRFLRMMQFRRKGFLVIADRFPQMEVPGPMDGCGLYKVTGGGLKGLLARSERQLFARMVACKPDLIIRLNVSLDVAIARKPDHKPDNLARKINDLSNITFKGVNMLEINADQPLETVLSTAKNAISEILQTRDGNTPSESHAAG